MSQHDFTLAVVSDRTAPAHEHTDPLRSVEQALQTLGTAVTEITTGQSPRLLKDKSGLLIVVDRLYGQASPETAAAMDTLRTLVRAIREQNDEIPVFLYGEQLTARSLPTEVL